MALADITLADGQSTPVNHTFAFVAQNGPRVIRSELAAPMEEPLLLTMSHGQRTVGGKVIRNHLFRIDATVLDSDDITPYQVNIRLAADVPSSVFSDALAADLAAYIRNWASAANVTAWLKGSVG